MIDSTPWLFGTATDGGSSYPRAFGDCYASNLPSFVATSLKLLKHAYCARRKTGSGITTMPNVKSERKRAHCTGKVYSLGNCSSISIRSVGVELALTATSATILRRECSHSSGPGKGGKGFSSISCSTSLDAVQLKDFHLTPSLVVRTRHAPMFNRCHHKT